MKKEAINAFGLVWAPVNGEPEYSGPGEWIFEASYKGLRVACGYNSGGPVAWVGHPVEDRWIDSVACDGSFESGAKRAMVMVELALADNAMLESLRFAPELIAAMRDWAKDCAWRDVDEDDVDEMPLAELLRGIERHYDGGMAAFIRDGLPLPVEGGAR